MTFIIVQYVTPDAANTTGQDNDINKEAVNEGNECEECDSYSKHIKAAKEARTQY